MNNAKFTITTHTVVKFFGIISVALVTILTLLMALDVIPKYDYYLLTWVLVMFGFSKVISE